MGWLQSRVAGIVPRALSVRGRRRPDPGFGRHVVFLRPASRQASDFSHENSGWQLAWDTYGRTGKPTAVNMRIALQQIVEDDPWIDLPLLNDDDILAAAGNGVGADW